VRPDDTAVRPDDTAVTLLNKHVINLLALASIVGIPGSAVNVTAPEPGASHGKAK